MTVKAACRLCGTPFSPRRPGDLYCCGGCAVVDHLAGSGSGAGASRAVRVLGVFPGYLAAFAGGVALFNAPQYLTGEAATALAPLFGIFALAFLTLSTATAMLYLHVTVRMRPPLPVRVLAWTGLCLFPLLYFAALVLWIVGLTPPLLWEAIALLAFALVGLLRLLPDKTSV